MLESGRRTVLVVEDNPTTLKVFRLALESAGYRVLVALDARTALERVANGRPDLVLQDMLLPDMDGFALMRVMRALPHGKLLPIIAISGFKTLLDRAGADPQGFTATLLKPLPPSEIVERVKSYLPLPVQAEDRFGTDKSILVIDDDLIQLKLLRLRLEHAGFVVKTAADETSALHALASWVPDVVLCDVLMPEADGYELCQRLRSINALAEVPVVLMSAYYGGVQDEKLAQAAGASTLVMRTPELGGVLAALRVAVAVDRVVPNTTTDLPERQHADRVMAQLERQARANAGFAERAALQAAQLSILAGISEALLRSDDVEAAFGDVLTACLDAGGISRGALYRIDEQGQLILGQAVGFPEAASGVLERAFGCSARVVAAGQGVVVPASRCMPEIEARKLFEPAGLVAAVFIPFREGDRCIGALLLGSSTAELDEPGLMVFARAIGAHISQALALTESFSRLRDAAEAGRVLSASLDQDETLAALARLATARLADVCEIALVDDEPRVYTSGRTCDPSLGSRIRELRLAYPRVLPESGAAVPATPRPSELIREITEEKLRQAARSAEHLQLLQGLGLKSEIVVPLLARGRMLGVVSFARVREGRGFTARDQVTAEDLASRAAIAIDNASLYKLAQDASRMKDEFLATVSHELRTPLTSILGWSRMLTGGLASGKRDHAYRVIERNALAQAQLIEDLLDTSRIISGQMRLELQPTELTRVIDFAVESLKPALELKRVRLRRFMPGGAVRVRGDAARLQQVIWNLLSNAVKFTPSGGHVDITVTLLGTHVVLTVADDGQGIAPEFLDMVFDRFKQAEGGITRAQGGLGLGLAIARHLVELHGGTISVFSEGKGRGSSFTVELPIADHRTEEPLPKNPDSATRRAKMPAELTDIAILVVDDDQDTRELLLEALAGCGARASGAASAAEALEAVARERPDVLLSDIGMPGEDGYALIRRIRTLPALEGGTIPAAAITAYNRAEDRSLALDAGFQLHIPKPIDPSDLIAAVVRLKSMEVAVSSA